MKRLKVRADGGDFARRRRLGIDGDWGRAVAFKTAREQGGGLRFAEAGRIEKNPLRVRREVAAAGELGHGEAVAGEQTQRALGATEKKTMTIAHSDEAGDAMLALQARGGEENLQLTGALTSGVAG